MRFACVVKCDATGMVQDSNLGVAAAVVGIVPLEPSNLDQNLLDGWRIASAHAETYRDLTVPRLEYAAILLGLKSCRSVLLMSDMLVVYSDSQLAVNQINRVYACRNKGLKPYLCSIDNEKSYIRRKYNLEPRIVWISRKLNSVADSLAGVFRAHALEAERCSLESFTITK